MSTERALILEITHTKMYFPDLERRRIRDANYDENTREELCRLLDVFETGDFYAAARIYVREFDSYLRSYTSEAVSDILEEVIKRETTKLSLKDMAAQGVLYEPSELSALTGTAIHPATIEYPKLVWASGPAIDVELKM